MTYNDTKEISPIPFAYDFKGKKLPIKEYGLKVVVTDYGLAHWLAANNGFNINDFPNKNDSDVNN